MTAGHNSCFSLKVLNLYVKKGDTLLLKCCWWQLTILRKFKKRNLDLHQFLANCILPEGIAIFANNPKAILKCFWYLDAKLVGSSMISRIDGCNYAISSPQGVHQHPKCKCRFTTDTMGCGVFGYFYWV